ncbi:protein containing DUF1080 [Rhodopirellula sp. SWK7]|nr:protein containing DUF1080 [Rhodopirellula sp. SWK7]
MSALTFSLSFSGLAFHGRHSSPYGSVSAQSIPPSAVAPDLPHRILIGWNNRHLNGRPCASPLRDSQCDHNAMRLLPTTLSATRLPVGGDQGVREMVSMHATPRTHNSQTLLTMKNIRTGFAFFLVLVSTLHLTEASGEQVTSSSGFRSIFTGTDLSQWHGEVTMDPRKLAAMPEEERAEKMALWQKDAIAHWKAEDGELINDGHGVYLTTDQSYGDFELLIEYKTIPQADSGIYLKSNPQVQIWNHQAERLSAGQDKGSGGLWNNSPGAPGKDPSEIADRPFGEWNQFRILQVGTRTSVWLNDKHIVDHAIMENYWDRKMPLVAKGPIQLQTHGGEIRWRNIMIREIEPEEANEILRSHDNDGFTVLSNGQDLSNWAGAADNYEVVDGAIRCKKGKGGVLHTPEEYADFVARIEFKLPPAGNNGLAIRYPGSGDPAYAGMCELQVLDTEHPRYQSIDPRQAHGSAYGMIAAQRGYLRPTGEWNFQEVTVQGSKIKVELNGTVILDGDLEGVTEFMANSPHPGKGLKQGFFGFAGHGDAVEFRNVQIKTLP